MLAESTPSDRRWYVLTAIGVSTFMSALDGSVVNTVLPVMRRDLHTTVAGIEWVATVYLLAISALLLGVGRAGDARGHKRMYVGGFVLFVLGSALCGIAPTAVMLIAMRGLQGIGAAMLFANAPAILTMSFPAAQRGRALGAQGTFTYLGLTAGPSLGGWLAQSFGWRSVFFINIPVGAIGILLALRVIDDDRPEATGEPFDYTGATVFAAGLVVLLIALNLGHAWGWTSLPTLSLSAAAIILLAFFIGIERRKANPMLDLTLFGSRVFSAATVSALLNYISIFSATFVLPFLLVQSRGLGTRAAGLVLTAQPIVMAIVAPISGALSDRIGSRLLATLGMLVLAIGLALIAGCAATGSLASIAGGLAVAGLGVGLFVSPNNSALMGAAHRQRQGIAAGILATARNVGMVLGFGLSGAIFTTILANGGHEALVHGVEASLYAGAAVALLGAVTAFVRE
ncbi:MAG TPA: DHA2 family efflux MFS transporter permease subunit [Thermoanaerobaculia bacterium]|nr:DHA2 family efflux MFS transporter permease subunit [Thermoanaerobaculia bacterium]